MKRAIFIIGILSALFAFNPTQVRASHAMGASITYKWINDTTYEITYKFYRDCAGIAAPASVTIDLAAAQCGLTLSHTLTPKSSHQISPVCDSSHLSTCNGGTLPGTEEYTYSDTVTIPHCQQWVISYSECCRNSAITNLVDASAYDLYISTTLDNASIPIDNSPQFLNIPAIYLTAGQLYNVNFGAYDIDGDSLSYAFVNPLGNGATPLGGYNGGLDSSHPLSSSTPISLDTVTGIFSVTPDVPQVGVVAIEVREYRQGIQIGAIRRDIQMIVTTGTNNVPNANGVNNSGQYHISVCANDSMTFTIPTQDADTNDRVTINVLQNIPGAVYSVDTSSRPTLTFTWAPDSTMVKGIPYILNFEVSDNACPFNGKQAYSVAVYVNNCNNGSVWPGDANNDFVADVYDVLPIGIAYGDVGFPRPNASTIWAGQPCGDWGTTLPSGVDVKNADCNGDGVVDSNDVSVVYANYGFVHNKTSAASSADLSLHGIATPNTFHTGDTVVLTLILGDSAYQANDAYGVAFHLQYDNHLFELDTAWRDFSNNWMHSGGLLSLQKAFVANGAIDIATVRTNHTNITGYGELGQFRFFAKAPIVASDSQSGSFNFSGIKLVNAQGTDIPVSPVATNVTWSRTVSGIDDSKLSTFELYPNPTTGQLHIVLPGNQVIDKEEIFNAIGEKVTLAISKIVGNKVDLSMPDAPMGLYLVTVTTTTGQVMHQKFLFAK